MSDTKLLPCPFCPEAPELVYRKRYSKYVVLCDNARCSVGPSTPECDTEAEAIGRWNTRTPDPRLAAAESLADALKELRKWHKEEYKSNPHIDARADAALAAWEKLK